jgi:hypothetical protein
MTATNDRDFAREFQQNEIATSAYEATTHCHVAAVKI